MPINNWNFYRSFSTGADLKAWNSENPQVEDGRDGGNPEFDGEVTDQYTAEVAHMMRRVRLNMYRAEDEMFIIRKRQWREEDAEFAKEQARRSQEAKERRKKKNLMRRMRRQCHSVKEEDDGDGDS